MTFEPRPSTATGAAFFLGSEKRSLLGRPAGVPQRDALDGIEALHALGQRGRHGVGQGEVHVIAAQEDMLAHGQPRQGEVARPRRSRRSG